LFLELLEIRWVFERSSFLHDTWNDGMLEYWNDDLKKMTILYLIPVSRNFTIPQLSIFPEPNIPEFRYSNIPIVSEAN